MGSNYASVTLLHFGHREYVLFPFWKVGSDLGLVASTLMVVLIGVLHDAILGLRVFLDREILLTRSENTSMHSHDNMVFHGGYSGESGVPSSARSVSQRKMSSPTFSTNSIDDISLLRHIRRVLSGKRLMQAFLYAIQWTLFFTLILIVCTFNVWLIIAAILGKSIGYLVFIGSPAFETVERISLANN